MVKIEWSSSAENDLMEIIDYIAQDSVEYALSFYELVHEKIKNLEEFPKIGRKIPKMNDPRIRELILKNFHIIYRILDKKIQIIRLIHGSRKLDL